MFEHKTEPLLPRAAFYLRLGKHFLFTLVIVACSLGLGSAGYHRFAELPWIDSFHCASMILTGMGPVAEMKTTPAKLFNSFYALYSGIAFLSMMATLLAPVVHRFMHRIHLEEEGED